ncbi:MAG TPA: hypothetical protein VH877_12880 [Polyangia bacterium]|jgi:hypothetical protein|nr:hypothetical protein [Polyangia bacterium]
MAEANAWQGTVTLPVGYPDEQGNLLREVHLRKMTGKEEAILADAQLRQNGGKLISALLASCITGIEGMDKVGPQVARRLYSADRNYLLLELRRLTFGDQMEAHYRCPRCQSSTAVDEDLSTLEVRRIDDNAAATLEIRVTLKDGYKDNEGHWHHEFVFGLPTGEDEEVAAGRRDSNAARQRDALMARCLRQVGTLDPRKVQAMGVRILADLSMVDRRAIQKALDAAAPGPDMTRTVECKGCGDEFRTSLDMSQFFPLG